MPFIFVTNLSTTLASALASGATTCTLASGTNVPAVVAPNILKLTIVEGANLEIVHVTAATAGSPTLTIVRAQEGTASPASFSTQAVVEARLTKGIMDALSQISGGTYTGPVSVTGSSDAVQLLLKGNTVQTQDILEVRKSDNTLLSLINSNGYVGIGASSPVMALDVNKTGFQLPSTTIYSVAQFTDGVPNKGIILGYDNAAQTGVVRAASNAASSNLAFWTYDTGGTAWAERVRISSNGNVGIGTTAPLFPLQVHSAIITGTAGGIFVTDSSAVAAEVGGQIILGGNYTGTTLTGFGVIRGIKENATDNNYASALTFYTRANGAGQTEKVRIDSQGNVGIGTTNPGSKLEVTGVTTLASGSTSGRLVLGPYNTAGVPWSILQLGTGSDSFRLRSTSNTELLYVSNTGNLGIGTTTPTGLLQVAQPTAGVGTVSNLAGGTTVTGVGTQFTNTFKVGDTITIPASTGQTVAISAIASDTSMTTAAITLANSGVAYSLVGGTRFTVNGNGNVAIPGAINGGAFVSSNSSTAGIGYATGAGGAVTQLTSRTTGVTINNVCGAITLVSAAGSATWQTFTVTNSAVAATDLPYVIQKSGTDLYEIHVTAVALGSFNISFRTTGGTTTEQPVFSFDLRKAVTA